MSCLNHKGPEEKGPRTGRKLGLCNKNKEQMAGNMGQGMGMRRKSGNGSGQGLRRKTDEKN